MGATNPDDRGASIEPTPDPLYAARVKLEVERRLFGGTTRTLRVGRFELMERIGAGAMSVVYAARDPELERKVALKLLQDDVRSERLMREARALARLRHPHVVAVYEVGRWGGHLFLALEHVQGQTLGTWRSDRPRTTHDVVRVMSEVADGLAAVHALGLVHRDVKPDNVVVDVHGSARLVDFGLVTESDGDAVVSEGAPAHAAANHPGAGAVTRPGAIPGTPRYIAPERAAGSPASALSDQYSFGITLAEMLEGLAVPPALAAVVARARADAPQDRHDDMRALLAALRAVSAPRSSRGRRALLAALVVVVTLPMAALAFRAPPSLEDQLVEGTDDPQAREAQRSGLRALRDGSLAVADASFRHASELDADYGASYLWQSVLMSHGDVAAARETFERAFTHRAGMSEANRSFLDALSPCIQSDPVDDLACETRLRRAAEASPERAYLWYELARHRWNREGSSPAVLADFERALTADPDLVLARFAQGQLLAYLGRFDDAVAASEACLRLVPGSTACIRNLAWIHAELGQCDALDADARRWRAAAPADFEAYAYLASSALARGESIDAVRELARLADERAPEGERAFFAARDRAELAIVVGDFEGARVAIDAMDEVLATRDDRVSRLLAARLRIRIALETGERDEAGRLAAQALATTDAWAPDPRNEDFSIAKDDTPELLDVLRETGVLTDAERAARRAPWLEGWRARIAPAYRPFLWLSAYARNVDDETEANEALAAMEPSGPPPFHPLAHEDAGIGRVYLFSGHVAEAIPYLRRASLSCHTVEFTFGVELPFETMRASRDLGRALEGTGDRDGACAAYQRVIGRWGAARPASVTAQDARARATALGCETTAPGAASSAP